MNSYTVYVFAAATLIGTVIGTTITAACTIQRPPKRWTVLLRMPESLYRQLQRCADTNMQPVHVEILDRLQKSLEAEAAR